MIYMLESLTNALRDFLPIPHELTSEIGLFNDTFKGLANIWRDLVFEQQVFLPISHGRVDGRGHT